MDDQQELPIKLGYNQYSGIDGPDILLDLADKSEFNLPNLISRKKANSFLTELDKRVRMDTNDEEASEVISDLEDIMSDLMVSLVEFEPRLMGRSIRSGSSVENVRVGDKYEFDYMLELTSFKPGEYFIRVITELKALLFCKQKEWYNGITISSDLLQMLKKKFPGDEQIQNLDDQWVALSYYDMVYLLLENLGNCFDDMFFELPPDWELVSSRILDVDSGYMKHNTGIQIAFKYKSKVVMVDLIPCVKFPAPDLKHMPSITDDKVKEYLVKLLNPDSSRETLSVNNLENQLYIVPRKPVWRVSTSVLETTILQHLPEDKKLALRIVKYLVQLHVIQKDEFFQEANIGSMKDYMKLISVTSFGYTEDHVLKKEKELFSQLTGIKASICSYTIKTVFLKIALYYVSRGKPFEDNIGMVHLLLEALRKLYENPFDQPLLQKYAVVMTHFLWHHNEAGKMTLSTNRFDDGTMELLLDIAPVTIRYHQCLERLEMLLFENIDADNLDYYPLATDTKGKSLLSHTRVA